jgi:hypothetical protein
MKKKPNPAVSFVAGAHLKKPFRAPFRPSDGTISCILKMPKYRSKWPEKAGAREAAARDESVVISAAQASFFDYFLLTSAKFSEACRPQRQRAATFI